MAIPPPLNIECTSLISLNDHTRNGCRLLLRAPSPPSPPSPPSHPRYTLTPNLTPTLLAHTSSHPHTHTLFIYPPHTHPSHPPLTPTHHAHTSHTHASPTQVAFADMLLLNKTDLVPDEADLKKLEGRLRSLNKWAPIERCTNAGVALEKIMSIRGFELDRVLEMDPEFLNVDGEHMHDDRVSSVGFRLNGELDMDKTNAWIAKLLQARSNRARLQPLANNHSAVSTWNASLLLLTPIPHSSHTHTSTVSLHTQHPLHHHNPCHINTRYNVTHQHTRYTFGNNTHRPHVY